MAFDRRWLYRGIGLVIFVVILSTVDLSKLRAVIEGADRLWLILAALPITYLVTLIRYYRWFRICRRQEIPYPFWEGFLIYVASFGLGIITPGRLGELIKVNYLKNRGNLLGRSFFCVLLDRGCDVGTMIVVALLGALFMIPNTRLNMDKHILPISAGVIAILVAFYFLHKWWKPNESPIRPSDGGIATRIRVEAKHYPAYFRAVGWDGGAEIALLTFVSWAAFAGQQYLFVTALCLDLTFLQIGVFTCITGLVALLPVSISGLGTREATLIYLFSLYQISKAGALIFSGCMLLSILFCGLGSVVAWEMPRIRQMLVSLRKTST